MVRTRESLEELRRVSSMLTMRQASPEELQGAMIFVIDTFRRLVQDLEECGLHAPEDTSISAQGIAADVGVRGS
jgi:hypothetical protein